MQVSVPRERAPHERRVALVPESVSRLVKGGATVVVERGAGAAAFASDEAYIDAGAAIAPDAAAACAGADVVTRVQRPSRGEVDDIPEGAALVCLLGQPGADADAVLARLESRRVRTLALERVPRITRAQSMDVLSSQSTVAG